MEVGTEVVQRRGPAAEVPGDGPGLQGPQAQPHVPRRGGHRLQQIDEACPVPEVLAPGGDLDAGEDDLPVALLPQPAGLLHSGLYGQGTHRPPSVGDDAVGAEVDAAVLHLQHGPGPLPEAPGGQDLELTAAEGLVQLDHRLPLPDRRLQQVQKPHPVPGAGDQVHVQLLHILGLCLGVAAAHRHHRVRGQLPGPADHLPGFLVADGGDGAGVDDVGVRRALEGDQVVAPAEELPLHGLALVLVHLAPQGINGNSQTGPPLCFFPLYDIIKN